MKSVNQRCTNTSSRLVVIYQQALTSQILRVYVLIKETNNFQFDQALR